MFNTIDLGSDRISRKITSHARNLLEEELKELIDLNIRLCDYQYSTFSFRGEQFFHKGAYRKTRTSTAVHYSTIERFVDYKANLKKLDTDAQRIKQGLVILTSACKSYQDIRDAVPEFLLNKYMRTGYQQYEREKEPAWTIKNDPIKFKEYEKMIELIYYYNAMELME